MTTPSVIRDIPSLHIHALKAISKQPSKYISESKFNRAIKLVPTSSRDHMTQVILDR